MRNRERLKFRTGVPWLLAMGCLLMGILFSRVVGAAAGVVVGADDYTINADNDITLSADDDTDGNGAVVITRNATVGGTLSVTGGTTLTTLGTSGLATLDSASVTNNTAVGGTLSVTGGTTLSTLGTSGLATLNSTSVTNNASVGGTLSVTGNSSLSTMSTSGLATLNSTSVTNNASVGGALSVTGNASVGGTLDVTGATTLSSLNTSGAVTVAGATTLNSTLSVDSNGATAGGNTLTVDATEVSMASGTNSLTVDATNGTTIEGNLTVNGNIVGFSPTTSSGITNGNSSISVGGTENDVIIIADDNSIESDGRGKITVSQERIDVAVINTSGNTHGLVITETETVLTGGSTSTSLTLNDAGATFSNTDTGGPARVTGVADGVGKHDAVNVNQLKSAYAGIASVAALAAIPEAQPGKRHSLGMGLGYYEGEQALAIGYKSRLSEHFSLSGGIGRSRGNTSANLGIGLSW
ncbi:MAG: YadA-like family protein [Sedimenticola sp.]